MEPPGIEKCSVILRCCGRKRNEQNRRRMVRAEAGSGRRSVVVEQRPLV